MLEDEPEELNENSEEGLENMEINSPLGMVIWWFNGVKSTICGCHGDCIPSSKAPLPSLSYRFIALWH